MKRKKSKHCILKSHRIWNENNPHNKIKSSKGMGSGNCKELIHHKDGNHDNDDSENQEKMTKSKHSFLHNKNKKLLEKTRAKISKSKMGNTIWLGRKHTKKTKNKMSDAKIGKKHSNEARKNMSKSKIGKKHLEKHKKSISIGIKKWWKRRKNES